MRYTLPNPAVYCAVVDERDVLAFSNGRSEQEFIVVLPKDARPKRVLNAATLLQTDTPQILKAVV